MPTSQMDPFSICNLALANIGQEANIQSFEDDTEEARFCGQFYDPERRFLLQTVPWRFALKDVTLAELDDELSPTYDFIYQVPDDLLQPIQLYIEGTGSQTINRQQIYPTQFELIGDSIQSSRPATCLRYIHDFQNAAKFDTLFIDTLTWKIAAKLAMVLSGDMQLSSQAEQQYVRRLADAKARNASAARKPNILSRSLSRARFGAIGGTGSGVWEAFPAGSVIVG